MEVISFRETDDEEDVRAKKVLLVEAVGTKPAKVASGQRVKKGELANPALSFQSLCTVSLPNVRFPYAKVAVAVSSTTLELPHAQFSGRSMCRSIADLTEP